MNHLQSHTTSTDQPQPQNAQNNNNNNQPSLKNIIDNLLTFSFNLSNDLETLHLCEASLEYDTETSKQDKQKLKLVLKEATDSLEREIKAIKDFNKYIENKRNVASSDYENYNLIKLRYNKLLIKIEKILSSTSTFSDISSKVPKRIGYVQSSSKKQRKKSRSNTQQTDNDEDENNNNNNQQQQQIENLYSINNNNNKNINLFNNNNNVLQQQQLENNNNFDTRPNYLMPRSGLKNNRTNSASNFNPIEGNTKTNNNSCNRNQQHIDMQSKEFIKKELVQLKEMLFEARRKIDTHEHLQYEKEMDTIRLDNHKIMQDCLMLKNDNTEMLHSIRALDKLAMDIIKQNKQVITQINDMKMAQQQSQFQQQQVSHQHQQNRSTNSNYNNVNNNNSKMFIQQQQQQHQQLLQHSQQQQIQEEEEDNNNNYNSGRPNSNNNNNQFRSYQQNEDNNAETFTKTKKNRTLLPQSQTNEEDVELLSSWAKNKLGKI